MSPELTTGFEVDGLRTDCDKEDRPLDDELANVGLAGTVTTDEGRGLGESLPALSDSDNGLRAFVLEEREGANII